MKKAGDLLLNISNLNPLFGKEAVIEVFLNVSGIILLPNELVFAGKNIRVLTSSIKKQEILMRKFEILSKLKELLPDKDFLNIY